MTWAKGETSRDPDDPTVALTRSAIGDAGAPPSELSPTQQPVKGAARGPQESLPKIPSDEDDVSSPPRRRPPPPPPLRPRYVAPGRSALLHWRLVVAITALTTAIGLGYGIIKSPLYSAESMLYVGKTISPSNPNAVAGLPAASQTIAGDYARLISTQPVIADASKRLGHPQHLGGTISATQIPQSSEIRVDATAGSQSAALRLANAAALAMIDSVNQINQTSQNQLKQLQDQYASVKKAMSVLQNQIDTDQAQLQALTNAGKGGSAEGTQLTNEIGNLNSQLAADTLQANSIQTEYENDYTPFQSDSQAISLVGPPSSRGSDRRTTLEIGGIAGLFGGLIIGTTVASLRDLREDRSHRRRPA